MSSKESSVPNNTVVLSSDSSDDSGGDDDDSQSDSNDYPPLIHTILEFSIDDIHKLTHKDCTKYILAYNEYFNVNHGYSKKLCVGQLHDYIMVCAVQLRADDESILMANTLDEEINYMDPITVYKELLLLEREQTPSTGVDKVVIIAIVSARERLK